MMFECLGYQLFTSLEEDPKYVPISNFEQELVKKCCDIANNGNVKRVKEVIKTCRKFPKRPDFKYYLSAVYLENKMTDQALNVVDKLLDDHPDYPYGKVHFADILFEEDEFDAEEFRYVLGGDEIEHILPKSEPVFLDLFLRVCVTLIRYHIRLKNQERITYYKEVIKEFDVPYGLHKTFLEEEIAMNELLILQKEEKLREYCTFLSYEAPLPKQEPKRKPTFTHAIIQLLYQNDLSIDEEIIHTILTLPRESVIPDLEEVIHDALRRFEYFNTREETKNYFKEAFFVIHAICLLGELGTKESLPLVLEFLSSSHGITTLYIGVEPYKLIDISLLKMVNGNIDTLQNMLFECKMSQPAQLDIIDAISYKAKFDKNEVETVVKCYEDILRKFLKYDKLDHIVDSGTIAEIVVQLIDLNENRLLPLIEDVHDKFIIDPMVCGDYSMIKQSFEEDEFQFTFESQQTLIESYRSFL